MPTENRQTKNKILLVTTCVEGISINTVSKEDKEGMRTTDDNSHYPLGLAYLHSVLEKNGNEVQTLFLNNHSDEYCYTKIQETLENFSPDVVAFQMLTQNRISTYRMIESIHKKDNHIHQVIGGIHATLMYEQIIEKYPYVIAVLGEGEATFPRLIEELSKKTPDFLSIDGIAFNREGKIITTRQRQLIKNLDEIPFPKHEIFFTKNRKAGSIMTTRGCPFNCSFCCLHSTSRRQVRMRSINNIIEEVEWMIQKFPQMTDIWIHDDTFFIDNQRVIDFCDTIIKRQIKINFICNGRFKPVSQEMVYKLEQANFTKVIFGLESGDNTILNKCHKGINQKDVINTYRLFAKTKINVYSHLIIGLPGETIETITETANFIKKLQKIKYVPNYHAALVTIFPGTEIYEIAKTAKFIDDSYWLTDKLTPIFAVENSHEQLIAFQEILLNNISQITALSTWSGFKAQFNLLPEHLKYLLTNKSGLKNFFFRLIKFITPLKFYIYLRKIYHFFKKLRLNSKVS